MSEPNGYLIHGTAFSSKEAAFEILVHNHEQELRFHKLWDEDAQPYYFEPQSQLTIPKSIAECLINFIEINRGTDFIIEELIYFKNMERSHCFEPELKLHDFVQNNTNICVIYLAGKALGVDLVKVVEG